jgi:CHAT domain-containing protein/Tfp pilus assembly protein PilF
MARALNITAMLLVGFLLAAPHAAFAQSLDDANALAQRVDELTKKGHYSEAIPLAQRVFAIREQTLGPDHVDVAYALNKLANLYKHEGHYSDVEPLYKRSLAIRQKVLGPDHPDVARSLSNLAGLYREQGHYADAEPLSKQSLAILENTLGPDHPDVARVLGGLAGLYTDEGRSEDAEPLYKRALAIREKVPGHDLDVANSLSDLAVLYWHLGRHEEAERLQNRSLTIQEKALGPDHPNVANSLNTLAVLYEDQARYPEATALYKRSLTIREKAFGPDHPDVAQVLINLGSLSYTEGRYSDAEALYKRSLAIRERVLGADHPDVSNLLNNLAVLYKDQGRYADAEPLYKRSLEIREKVLGPNHPDVASSLYNLAVLYRAERRYADAEPLYGRSLVIREKVLGPDHPKVADTLNNLAVLHEDQGHYDVAEPLVKRSLAIYEKVIGPDSPDVAQSLNDLAVLYADEDRYSEAETLYKRSLAIREKALGPDHRDVARSLSNLAALYTDQGRFAEAERLYQRVLIIQEKALSPGYPDIALTLNNLASLYVDASRYADALPLVRRAAQMGFPNKFVYLAVLSGAVSKSSMADADALAEGYKVVQRATSTAASKAVNQLAARFAAGNDRLAQLVRNDQDLSFENERLNKVIVEAASKEPSRRDPTSEQQIRGRLRAIASERAQIGTSLSQQFPDYAALARPEPLSVQETQELLADDEALIVYDFDRKSYAEVFTRSNARSFELKITATDLVAQIKALRGSLEPTFNVEASYRLYQSIFNPFADYISFRKRLSVVMNGALTSLPLQLLVTNDPAGKNFKDLDWLIRKYAITVVPSTASLKILREGKATATADRPMIGFGDPVFDRTVRAPIKQEVVGLTRSLPEFYRGVIADTKSLAEALLPLPETADELRTVARELGARPEDIKLRDAASVWTTKHARLDSYRVVYFATHALVAGEVEKFAKTKAEPALVLSIPDKPTEEDDGLLRASDVAMLKMNADFVVLSACNTAAGDKPGAEALSGLAQAFFYAGAKSLIASNWDVDSESTVALMTGLFEALKNDPHLSHAEALRLSMLHMIDNPSKSEWVQPKYWAPFIVVGEPQKH